MANVDYSKLRHKILSFQYIKIITWLDSYEKERNTCPELR